MSIDIKQNRVGDLYGKQRKIKEIYVKRRLAYSSGGTALWTLYNRGYVDGVNWSGNRLPHQNYYNASVCRADFSHAEADEGGYMRLSVNGTYSLQYNTHVCGSAAVTVPSTATKMKVIVEMGRLHGAHALRPAHRGLRKLHERGKRRRAHVHNLRGHIRRAYLRARSSAGNRGRIVGAGHQHVSNADKFSFELKIHKIWFE